MKSEIIITCGCGDTEAYAKDAFKILYDDYPMPEVYSLGGDRDELILTGLNILNTDYNLGIDPKKAFALFVRTTDDGFSNRPEVWVTDLLTGEALV